MNHQTEAIISAIAILVWIGSLTTCQAQDRPRDSNYPYQYQSAPIEGDYYPPETRQYRTLIDDVFDESGNLQDPYELQRNGLNPETGMEPEWNRPWREPSSSWRSVD